MTRRIHVHFLPDLVDPESLEGSVAVVIDVLRATTTIVHACANGASAVHVCADLEEARRLAGSLKGSVLLGGERGGLRIDGFDLGNSPSEYSEARVCGKQIVMTTTNGTRAMDHCRCAKTVIVAAFANFSAVCRALSVQDQVEIVCAGTDRRVSREDVLLAGALVDDALNAGPVQCNDQAALARDCWQSLAGDLQSSSILQDRLSQSLGGKNLLEIGQQHDIEIAAQLDRFDILPQLDPKTGVIRTTDDHG